MTADRNPFVGEDAAAYPPATWNATSQWRDRDRPTAPRPSAARGGSPDPLAGHTPPPSPAQQVVAIGTAGAIFFGGLVGVVATLAADRLRRAIGGGR